MTRRTLAAAAGLLLGAAPLAAQEHPPQPWERRTHPTASIGADALFSTIGTSGGDRVHDGGGFDVHAGLSVSAFSLAAGYQRTMHDYAGASSRATYSGPYVEPRLSLDLGGTSFTPYLAGRVGRLTQKTPASTTNVPGSRTGTLLGAGGGVLVYVSHAVALDVGAMWSTLEFGSGTDAIAPSPYVGGGGAGALLKAGLRVTP